MILPTALIKLRGPFRLLEITEHRQETTWKHHQLHLQHLLILQISSLWSQLKQCAISEQKERVINSIPLLHETKRTEEHARDQLGYPWALRLTSLSSSSNSAGTFVAPETSCCNNQLQWSWIDWNNESSCTKPFGTGMLQMSRMLHGDLH